MKNVLSPIKMNDIATTDSVGEEEGGFDGVFVGRRVGVLVETFVGTDVGAVRFDTLEFKLRKQEEVCKSHLQRE